MRFLIRVRLLSLQCLHAFAGSIVTLSAVHLCSLASYQEGLLRLVHAWQMDTHGRDSLRLRALLRGLDRLHLERELLCLCGVVDMGQIH